MVNYFAALRHVEKQAAKKRIAHEDVLRLQQGAMDLIRPLVKAKLVKRVGTLKNGRYVLR